MMVELSLPVFYVVPVVSLFVGLYNENGLAAENFDSGVFIKTQ